MKNVGLRLRLEEELREQFTATCRLQGRPAAEVLRAFMRDYVVRENGGLQKSLFDEPSLTRPRSKPRGKKKWAKRS